ncbi:MAG TPA: hypothetical protein H9700_13000, partial [Candidatus Eisenbergiella intestinipullorum]|nr:hypothetical protein [Candidatus Eisenbergiella intestinipullorum]
CDVCLYYKALKDDFLSRNSDFRLSGIALSYHRTGDGKCHGILRITVEVGGDTTKLSSALSGVNKESKNTQSQLKDGEPGKRRL